MDSTPFAGIRVNVVAVLRSTSSIASQVPSGCCAACTVSSGGGAPTVTLTLSPPAKAEFFGFGVIASCTCFIELRSHPSETAQTQQSCHQPRYHQRQIGFAPISGSSQAGQEPDL